MSDLDKAIRTWFEDNCGPDAGDVAVRAVYKLLDEHKAIGIYDQCGHEHHPHEPGVKDVNDVGLVCAEGLTYEVCAACCEWTPLGGQNEHCASEHDHHWGGHHCLVVATIAGVVEQAPSVSGEDTAPAARQPRVWLHRGTGYDPDPGGDVRVVDCHGDIWTPRDRGPGDRVWETPDTAPFRWDYVLKKWGPLTEVVTPEGPA